MVTQVEIARRVGLDVSSVNKILNRRQGPVFRKETIKKVFKVAREMGYDFNKLKFTHRRRYPRTEVAIGADFAVYRRDGSLYDQGAATIRDLSQCGACVSDVSLAQGNLPAEPFTVSIKPKQKGLEDVELQGRVVRIMANGTAMYGIEFSRLDPNAQKKLAKVCR